MLFPLTPIARPQIKLLDEESQRVKEKLNVRDGFNLPIRSPTIEMTGSYLAKTPAGFFRRQ